jgi:hypothetical protein
MSFGFMNTDFNGEEGSKCLFCLKILAADSTKLNKLKRHLEAVHAEFIGKTPEFFHRKTLLFPSCVFQELIF